MNAYSVGSMPCHCNRQSHDPILIALTGGPGAGKTAVLELARRTFCEHVAILPEAAGIVFEGGFPRHHTEPGRIAAQLAIFHVQRSLEYLAKNERQVAIALCDRGTLDGIAYWPIARSRFFAMTGTNLDDEMLRYSAVIHLRSPSAEQGYKKNAIRIESAEEAHRIDKRIARVWAQHPHLLTIPSADEFLTKATAALDLVRKLLPECCKGHEAELTK